MRRPSDGSGQDPEAAQQPPETIRIAGAVGRMSGVTVLTVLLAFVTAPVQARALGPTGRGDLAAIIVVFAIAPTLLDFGLAAFVARELSRGTAPGEIYGTTLVMALVFSLIGVGCAIPVGHLIGGGRPQVTFFVELVLWMSPVNVGLATLHTAAWGQRDWGLINRLRLTPPLATAVLYVGLYASGRLTVETAAIVTIGVATLSGLQVVPMALRARRWTCKRSLAVAGLRFGSRSWLTTVFAQGNGYLDQLMMTVLTSPRQLGLYAVATTVSSVSLTVIVAPMTIARYKDVAMGDYRDVGRLCRMMLIAVAALGVLIGTAGLAVVRVLFGASFDGALVMILILLVSSVPAGLGNILVGLLSAAGQPGAAVRTQGAALVCSIPLLAIVLPAFGGVGASVVDVAVNTGIAVLALRYARRTFGGHWSNYYRPTTTDARQLRRYGERSLRSLRERHR